VELPDQFCPDLLNDLVQMLGYEVGTAVLPEQAYDVFSYSRLVEFNQLLEGTGFSIPGSMDKHLYIFRGWRIRDQGPCPSV